ncbi:MAG TPA: hypothetical protein VI819_03425 [Patescibacteria group bacterium]|nr:hypothetical protein [Patescibacteria group bacterium]
MNSVNKAKNDLAKVSPMALWDFEYETKTWKSVGSPPTCPDPFTFPAPADLSLASGILYPGQIRGGDYKPHGGARFDNLPNNELNVYSPFDGKLYQAARHLESGEMQYSLYFINDCGMMYKLDHLRKLTDKFERLLEPIPTGAEGDSRTTMINPAVFISKGELVATEVGIIKTKNVFFDFGVYDLRQRNGVDYSGKDYFNIEQYGMHGVCWMDYLQEPDKSLSYSLPGADGQSGKKSDYCK